MVLHVDDLIKSREKYLNQINKPAAPAIPNIPLVKQDRIIDAEDVQQRVKPQILKIIHEHKAVPVIDHMPVSTPHKIEEKKVLGFIDKRVMMLTFFPLAVGIFFGASVQSWIGLPGIIISELIFIGIIVAVMSQ